SSAARCGAPSSITCATAAARRPVSSNRRPRAPGRSRPASATPRPRPVPPARPRRSPPPRRWRLSWPRRRPRRRPLPPRPRPPTRPRASKPGRAPRPSAPNVCKPGPGRRPGFRFDEGDAMTAEERAALASQLLQEAGTLLGQTGLFALLQQRYDTVLVTGSAGYDLMVGREIDLYLPVEADAWPEWAGLAGDMARQLR